MPNLPRLGRILSRAAPRRPPTGLGAGRFLIRRRWDDSLSYGDGRELCPVLAPVRFIARSTWRCTVRPDWTAFEPGGSQPSQSAPPYAATGSLDGGQSYAGGQSSAASTRAADPSDADATFKSALARANQAESCVTRARPLGSSMSDNGRQTPAQKTNGLGTLADESVPPARPLPGTEAERQRWLYTQYREIEAQNRRMVRRPPRDK